MSEQIDPLGDCLQHAEFNSFVHELHKVARPRSARVNIAVRYGEPAKDRLDCGDRFALPADHKTAAGEGAMRSTGRSHIDEMQSALSHASMTPNKASPIALPPLAHHVPPFHPFSQP